ncbi:MAG: Mut7-C ubiquitin/RNAse domain-containing protein [Rhizobacter sp.]|nr:Mut7-C ubiquitin/RNAse domain-containing protein [Rhizobacter sp.]
MVVANFRFYEELNDFLAPDRRGHEFRARCARAATTKHMIEALGVPHTEVELILVNGESVGFDRLLADDDRVAVYPVFETFDVTPLLRLRARPLRNSRFVADAHLGGLAHLLRMMGYDTLYDNRFDDAQIELIAITQRRIVLTRDRDLLKRGGVTHGCFVRALRSRAQLREVFARLDLARGARPFTRCLSCNATLQPIARAEALPKLPPRVAAQHERFSTCPECSRVFWEGSHWQRMRGLVEDLLAPAGATDADSATTTHVPHEHR